jgi:hypothetical protein
MVDVGEGIDVLARSPLNRDFQRIQSYFLRSWVQVVIGCLGFFISSVNQVPSRDLRSQNCERPPIHVEKLMSIHLFEMRHVVMAEGDLPNITLGTRY